MSILESHTSYFDIGDQLFEGMDVRSTNSGVSNGTLQSVDLIRRKYRNEMVNRIMVMPYDVLEGYEEYEIGQLELRQLIVSAFNTSLVKIMREDMDTFIVYLNRRAPFVDDMNDITLGDVMVIMAERLDKKYGGTIKFWLGFMFKRMGCTKKRVDFGDIMLNMVTYRHYSEYGYGLFGDKNKTITKKNHGFNEQYLRFVNEFMV